MLGAYIALIGSQKLQTELYVLSSLLKDRVYSGDLWHQHVCTGGDGGRHALIERVLMDKRRKRCQMEVSLYNRVIELLEQHWMFFGQSALKAGRPTSVRLNSVCSSFSLSSTWVTSNVQEKFFKAFQAELTMQAGLMVMSLATRCNNAHLHNLRLDLLILWAKLSHAQAEMELYTMAIENSHACDFCDGSLSMSPDPIVP
ncbi:hypothetical protein F4604DRAFT_1674282 [Suillus subluteus]|nr:hypothetical protein F4604DRAFT_1674282 [Suillus subluteus]